MSTVYIGIGSNLGERKQNIDRALEKLKTRKDIQVISVSSVIETDPIGCPDQPKFLNACCKIDTGLYPDEILNVLKSIEREMGRNRDSKPKKLTSEEKLKAIDENRLPEYRLESNGPSGKKHDNWGPRIIDLDILLYDDIIMRGNNLTIPHKLMHERFFVLKPLSEIAPETPHPVIKKTIKDILSGLEQDITEDENNKKP
jgi:2-amino-4-hydroxy-6-hydroxymethyldihydropteridine diphosphokinase